MALLPSERPLYRPCAFGILFLLIHHRDCLAVMLLMRMMMMRMIILMRTLEVWMKGGRMVRSYITGVGVYIFLDGPCC